MAGARRGNRFVARVIGPWLCLLLPALALVTATPLIPIPAQDQRGRTSVTLNNPRTFGTYTNANSYWRQQANPRNRILVRPGLWPMPPRTPLNAKISGRI